MKCVEMRFGLVCEGGFCSGSGTAQTNLPLGSLNTPACWWKAVLQAFCDHSLSFRL